MSVIKKSIVWSIPILFIMGSLFHFLDKLTGQNRLVGAVSPVNESVWEHCKMVVLPMIVFWVLSYLRLRKGRLIERNRWFTGALAALLASILTIPLLFYFYTSAFGIESIIIDIIILLVAIVWGQMLGYHVYQYGKSMPFKLSIFFIIAILLVFIVFTFKTPQLPIFRDPVTGTYGISQS